MTPKRQRIIMALAERLLVIRTSNGFETDAGLYLFWGPVVLGPDDPKLAIAVVPGLTETNADQGGRKVIVLPIEFHAVVQEDRPQPGTLESAWLTAELILGDIKRAIELDDLTLGKLATDLIAGEVTPLPRQEGSTSIGLAAEYRVTYAESWGDPTR